MTRGFVTIATGIERYYRIAANLLASYRHFTDNPMPFAIICEAENEYTEQFDDVILMDNPCRSYLDKVFLPCYAPYDETIFIDADCLAYRDLDDIWDVFEGAADFSVLGKSYPPDFPYAWFKREDIGEYADQIQFIPDFIGGVYYMRKSDALYKFAETSFHVWETYDHYKFRQFDKPCDEAIFALATAIHGFEPADRDRFPICFYPQITVFDSNIDEGRVIYDCKYDPSRAIYTNPYLIHWGSGNTWRIPYTIEVARLHHTMGQQGKVATACEIARIKAVYDGKQRAKAVLSKLHLLEPARNVLNMLKAQRSKGR